MQFFNFGLGFLLVTLLSLTASANHLCSCINLEQHPQTLHCEGDFIIQVNVKNVTEGDQENYIVELQESFMDKMNHFEISSSEILKDDLIIENFKECETALKLNTTYIISGRIISGKPTTSGCQLAIPLDLEQDNLVEQYKKDMINYCACKMIDKKPTDEMTTFDENKECILESNPQGNYCQKVNGVCLKNVTNGKCELRISPFYKSCIEDKRNRRHSSLYSYNDLCYFGCPSYPGCLSYPVPFNYPVYPIYPFSKFKVYDYDYKCRGCYRKKHCRWC